NQQSFNLVAARVTEGATPPLEQNMVLVELNRLRSQRESAEGKMETLILELKNLIGMLPEEPLRLRGDFDHLVDQLPSVTEAAESEGAKRRREFAELAVRHEIASAYAQYERSVRAMEIFRVGVNEQAKANLDVVRQTYELGSKTLIDYLAEERHFIDLETDFI